MARENARLLSRGQEQIDGTKSMPKQRHEQLSLVLICLSVSFVDLNVAGKKMGVA